MTATQKPLKLPDGSSTRGAQMGRPDNRPENSLATGTLRITRLIWVDGDYDEWGAYWGNAGKDDVYCAWGDLEGEEFTTRLFVRAASMEEAQAKVRERLPNVTPEHWTQPDAQGCDDFTRSYLETALWSSTDNSDDSGGDPMDRNYGLEDLAPETLAKAIADCTRFQELAGEMIPDKSTAGHDFWLTQNDHGAGFWDGDYPEHGGKLTEISKSFGAREPYVGDDGKIYF